MLGYLSKFRLVKKPAFSQTDFVFSTKPINFTEKPGTGFTKASMKTSSLKCWEEEMNSSSVPSSGKFNSNNLSTLPKNVSPYDITTGKTNFDANIVNSPDVPTSTCPEGFPLNVYTALCRAATVVDCINSKMSLESITMSSLFVHTTPGYGIKLTEFLFNNTEIFKIAQANYDNKLIINCDKLLSESILRSLPDHLRYKLSMISLKKEITVFLEIWAMPEVNRHLTHSRLGVAYVNDLLGVKGLSFDKMAPFRYEKDLYFWRNHYDNTANNHPDYVLVMDHFENLRDHSERVSESCPDRGFHPRNLIAYDLKLGQLEPSMNIVKSCYNDEHLIKQLVRVQRAFMYYLDKEKSNYSQKDQLIAKKFQAALYNNIMAYENTKDLSTFHATYNGFQETYSSFLLRNEVGFNFIIKQSITDLRVSEKDVSYFSDKFKKYFSTPGTTVNNFAKRISAQNTSVMDTNETIKSFVLQNLKK